MATFEYSAMTASDRLMKGIIEAGSMQEATELLEQMRLKVNSLEKARPERPKTLIARTEFLLFNQQLASLTKAGIPLEKGLRELSKDVASRPMRKLINSIAIDLEAGMSIERAFEKRKEHFPPLYGRILKAGVETGRLSEMLTSLNRHIEITNQTRRIVFEATAYPAVVFVMGSVIMTFVLRVFDSKVQGYFNRNAGRESTAYGDAVRFIYVGSRFIFLAGGWLSGCRAGRRKYYFTVVPGRAANQGSDNFTHTRVRAFVSQHHIEQDGRGNGDDGLGRL